MSQCKWFFLFISMVILNSCQFHQSVNKDLSTGAYSRGDGIGSDDVIIQINGKTANRNEFVYGEKIHLVFNDITGLSKSNGKTYPGLSMYVVKNEKDTVLSNSNLLTHLDDGTTLSPLQLQANFRTALPYRQGEKYKVHIEIWDKKGDGKFYYELPFTIKENDLLDLQNNGLEYSNIYLWNETTQQPVFDKNVSSEHLFFLLLNGIDGLKITNGKVFPSFSLELTDGNGNKVLSMPNMLGDYETEGIDPKAVKKQLFAKFSFTKGELSNPYRLKATLKDLNSSKEITMTTELNMK